MMFQPDAVRAGEWWRLLTHPFVHVTWYHLLLDGLAFFILYQSLQEPRGSLRLLYVLASAFGSLLFSWSSGTGLCGLSGVAHGLMAVSSIEVISKGPAAERLMGLATFCLVVSKAAFEAITGHMFFGFLDFG